MSGVNIAMVFVAALFVLIRLQFREVINASVSLRSSIRKVLYKIPRELFQNGINDCQANHFHCKGSTSSSSLQPSDCCRPHGLSVGSFGHRQGHEQAGSRWCRFGSRQGVGELAEHSDRRWIQGGERHQVHCAAERHRRLRCG